MLDNIDTARAPPPTLDAARRRRISRTLGVRLGDVAGRRNAARDAGVMVSVTRRGLSHAASADLSEAGLADAFARGAMADAVAGRMVFVPEGCRWPMRAAASTAR